MWHISILGIDFFKVFYCYFIYCFVGWIWETCYCSVRFKKLINRGFLNGPVVPIYGSAATLIFMAFFNPLMEELALSSTVTSYVSIFFLGALVASCLEYITSWSMEKMFHAKWWDYSDRPLNLKGRVCLPVSAFWGLLSIVLVKLLHPFVLSLIDGFPRKAGENIGYVIFVVFLADFVSTVIVTVHLDRKLTAIANIRKDFKEFAELFREIEVQSKIEFKDRYGETPLGDLIEHGFDRMDARIAFTVQGYRSKKAGFEKALDEGFAKVGTAFENNKEKLGAGFVTLRERFERLVSELREGTANTKKTLSGYSKYTATRFSLAFPSMRFSGNREALMKAVRSDKKEDEGSSGEDIKDIDTGD